MKLVGIVITTVLLLLCGPTTKAEDLADVKSDLALVKSEIQAAQTEDARYTGGLIKALIASRIATLRQTEAMLQQRLPSVKIGVPLKYTVEGKPFSLPTTASQMLADVESEIIGSQEKMQRQEAEVARFTGGLAQAMSLATLETMRQTHAMLEQKRVSLRYGLPQYIGFVDANSKGILPAAASPDAGRTAVSPANQKSVADELRKAIALSASKKVLSLRTQAPDGMKTSSPSSARTRTLLIGTSARSPAQSHFRTYLGRKSSSPV